MDTLSFFFFFLRMYGYTKLMAVNWNEKNKIKINITMHI